eukprot:jgi/Chrzof1/4739/Cz14g24150.t1
MLLLMYVSGFCGLVRVCDDPDLKERGVIRRVLRGPGMPPKSQPGSAGSSLKQLEPIAETTSSATVRTEQQQQQQQQQRQQHTTGTQQPAGALAFTPNMRRNQASQSTAALPGSQPKVSHEPQDDDMPMWVVNYIVAASDTASSTSGQDATGQEGNANSDNSEHTDSEANSDVLSSVSVDEWIEDLPSPPKHNVVLPKR